MVVVVVGWKYACFLCLFAPALVNQLNCVKKKESCVVVVHYLGVHETKIKGG